MFSHWPWNKVLNPATKHTDNTAIRWIILLILNKAAWANVILKEHKLGTDLCSLCLRHRHCFSSRGRYCLVGWIVPTTVGGVFLLGVQLYESTYCVYAVMIWVSVDAKENDSCFAHLMVDFLQCLFLHGRTSLCDKQHMSAYESVKLTDNKSWKDLEKKTIRAEVSKTFVFLLFVLKSGAL